ncbi:hypothetical protein L0156_14355 [bacterium]|nr:hypothetical protein [bacterium]
MKWTLYLPLLVLGSFLMAAGKPEQQVVYKDRNPELGIVYRPINWDRQQWDEVFRDPAPPASWAIMPIGRESCSALTSWWLAGVRNKGLRPAVLLDPFLTKQEIEKTIDCSVPLGIRRVVLDEYVSYHSKNLKRNLCTVISEARDIYQNAKRKYPSLQVDIDDNWHTWMVDLSRGQAGSSCGSYPYFQYDQTGISVLSKYGNPATGTCGRPTADEMREQLIDSKQTVRDFSKSGKIFVWQLNQYWYPGTSDVLQVLRETKTLYGFNRFLLFGPTTNNDETGNWGYKSSATREGCVSSGYHWYLPARDYLIRMTEGAKSRMKLTLPTVATRGSLIALDGKIVSSGSGVSGKGIELRITPPSDSLQRFERELIAPPKARLALLGVRVNLQLPHKVIGPATFQLERVQFSRTGSSNNLVFNSEFDNGLNDWLIIGTAPVTHGSNGSENYLQGSASANQSISVTSIPVFVSPKRAYTVRFDARILQEARNNGYFFVSWYTTKEVYRDRIFMNFPSARTVAKTNSSSRGRFAFQWQPSDPGFYTVAAFFPGSPSFQPVLKKRRIEIQ